MSREMRPFLLSIANSSVISVMANPSPFCRAACLPKNSAPHYLLVTGASPLPRAAQHQSSCFNSTWRQAIVGDYDTELIGRDEVDETQPLGLEGVVKIRDLSATVLPCSDWTVLLPPDVGRNSHRPIWTIPSLMTCI
jgi:hypothetical protein